MKGFPNVVRLFIGRFLKGCSFISHDGSIWELYLCIHEWLDFMVNVGKYSIHGAYAVTNVSETVVHLVNADCLYMCLKVISVPFILMFSYDQPRFLIQRSSERLKMMMNFTPWSLPTNA